MVKPVYNVQFCPCGHVAVAPPGSDLEKKAKERETKGFVDALILNSKECGTCQSFKEDSSC